MGRNVLIMIALLFLLSGNKNIKTGERMFFKTSFHPDKANRVNKLFFNFNDSIPDDTLKLYFSSDNLPVVFSRDISTAVCFDSLCRFVNLTLYWDCLLYTSDAADEEDSVDLGGRRIIKKKKKVN